MQPAAEVAVLPQSVTGLAGTDLDHPLESNDLLHAIEALLKVAPLRPQLEPALKHPYDGLPDERDLYDLLCTFGRFCMPDETVRPGDIVGGGDSWILAAGPNAGISPDRDLGRYEFGEFERPAEHWRPSFGLVIDPASPTGRYWGPGLWRWRGLLGVMQGGSYQVGQFIETVVAPTGLPVEREALLRTLAMQTQAVEETAIIRPGTILLDDDPDRAAVVITDTGLCRAAGTRRGADFHRMDIESARCRWLWVPHIG
jgi:hypothetical protein